MMKEFNRQFNRVFVTGDIHGDVADLACRVMRIDNPGKDDLLIILGDCAFFFWCFYSGEDGLKKDKITRIAAAELPITIVCIQGNHEVPFAEMDAEKIKLLGGDGYEKDGIYFADNGTVLNINGKTALVIGGAYSVDKAFRLASGRPYWEHEEFSKTELETIINNHNGKEYDYIFTHTCAISDMPMHALLYGVDQSKVSQRTEKALERIKFGTKYSKWFCGHFHTEFERGDTRFIFKDIEQII